MKYEKSIDWQQITFCTECNQQCTNQPGIIAAWDVFSYGNAKMKAEKVLYTKAANLQVKQVKEYGEQFATTDALYLAKATTNKTYIVHLKTARIPAGACSSYPFAENVMTDKLMKDL